jgi:hypothetical protein
LLGCADLLIAILAGREIGPPTLVRPNEFRRDDRKPDAHGQSRSLILRCKIVCALQYSLILLTVVSDCATV